MSTYHCYCISDGTFLEEMSIHFVKAFYLYYGPCRWHPVCHTIQLCCLIQMTGYNIDSKHYFNCGFIFWSPIFQHHHISLAQLQMRLFQNGPIQLQLHFHHFYFSVFLRCWRESSMVTTRHPKVFTSNLPLDTILSGQKVGFLPS